MKLSAKERAAAWAKANPERKKAAAKAYREANREKVKAGIDKWRAENPEKWKASTAAYRKNNTQKCAENEARWHSENKEKLAAFAAKWKAENPDKIKAAWMKWQEENRDKVNAANAKWRSENKDVWRIYKQNRRSRLKANGGKLSNGLAEKLFKLQRGKCACCGEPLGDNYHLDHIMPLALGGANEDWNIQLLRQRCNNQKHMKHPVEFMQSRGFLL